MRWLPAPPLFFRGSIGILNKIVNKKFCTYLFSLIIILFRIKMRHKTIKNGKAENGESEMVESEVKLT